MKKKNEFLFHYSRMSIDFFPPRFENPSEYIMILSSVRKKLLDGGLPFEIARKILVEMRNTFLDELEMEIDSGLWLTEEELVEDVEYKRAANRAISMKSMLNLIRLEISDSCKFIIPDDVNTPMDIEYFKDGNMVWNHLLVYRMKNCCYYDEDWDKTITECRFQIGGERVYKLKIGPYRPFSAMV